MCKAVRTQAFSGGQEPHRAPRGGKSEKPTITLLGEMFPADPVGIGRLLEPLGLAAGPVVPTREWRELYAALDCAAVAAIHPFYAASIREFQTAGRRVVGSAPVGHEGTDAWLQAIGNAVGVGVRIQGIGLSFVNFITVSEAVTVGVVLSEVTVTLAVDPRRISPSV